MRRTLLAYHRSDRRLTIGPKQEDENGNGNKERRVDRARLENVGEVRGGCQSESLRDENRKR